MADVPGKPTAQSYAAGGNREVSAGPLQWSDKCFLCGTLIGETDPRGFYSGSNAMMLCHRGCLNIMDSHGGTPEGYHRAMARQDAPRQAGNDPGGGPLWMDFPTLAAMISYVKAKGEIAPHVKVTVAGKVIQG